MTVTLALFVSACSMAAAIFLVLEMNSPLDGLMKISSAPPAQGAGVHGPVGARNREVRHVQALTKREELLHQIRVLADRAVFAPIWENAPIKKRW